MNKQKLISLDNGLTYHTPADLDPFELECRWSAIAIAMVETARDAAYDDKRWPRSAGAWRPFNAVLFLELYLEYANGSLTVG